MRSLVLVSCDSREPRHRLADEVEAAARRIGAGLAETRNRAIDDAWVDSLDVLVTDTDPIRRTRLEILDDNVGVHG